MTLETETHLASYASRHKYLLQTVHSHHCDVERAVAKVKELICHSSLLPHKFEIHVRYFSGSETGEKKLVFSTTPTVTEEPELPAYCEW